MDNEKKQVTYMSISDPESKNDSKESNNKDCVCCWHCLNIICNACKMQDRTDDKIQ